MGINKLFELVFLEGTGRVKPSLIASIFLILFSHNGFANDAAKELTVGDSLFRAKKYTEAFEHYQNVLNEGSYAPQMLLKMAYVKEALNDYPQALYYLNLAYYIHPDQAVLQKMEELADANELSGYEFSDYEYIASIYHEYHDLIAIVGTAFIVFGVGLLLWLKSRKSNLVFPAISLAVFIVFFASAINFGFPLSHGIIYKNQTFLMESPSAGSKLVATVKSGHRVEVLEKQDIWQKVRWNNEEVYVRSMNLMLIQ